MVFRIRTKQRIVAIMLSLMLMLTFLTLFNNLIQSTEATSTTITLSEVSLPSYRAIAPIEELKGYSLDTSYGKLYRFDVSNNYVYGLTDQGAVLRSTDLVNWEVLDSDVLSDSGIVSPVSAGIIATEDDVLFVMIKNSSNDRSVLLRSADSGATWQEVLNSTQVGCASNAFWTMDYPALGMIVETNNGTLIAGFYGDNNDGCVFRSDDKGVTWVKVFNATEFTSSSTKVRHIHPIVYDAELDRIIVGIDATPSGWGQWWAYSDDYGNTWNILLRSFGYGAPCMDVGSHSTIGFKLGDWYYLGGEGNELNVISENMSIIGYPRVLNTTLNTFLEHGGIVDNSNGVAYIGADGSVTTPTPIYAVVEGTTHIFPIIEFNDAFRATPLFIWQGKVVVRVYYSGPDKYYLYICPVFNWTYRV